MAGRHARHRAKTGTRGGRVAALEYSTVFSALTLLGLFVFGALSAYYFAFYGELGLTPSDVGLAQGEVLARAAYWLGTFLLAMVFLLAILGSFVLVVVQSVRAVRRRLHRPPPRRLPALARRVRRFLPPAECWALAALVFVAGMIEDELPAALLDAAILLVVFWPLAHVLGRTWRRRRLSVVVFSLLALGVLVFTLAQQGRQDAEHLERTGGVRTMSALMGIEHFYVLPQFAAEVAPRGYQQGRLLVLLGSGTDDTYALYDCAEAQVYRVYTGQVSLHVLVPQPQPGNPSDAAVLARLQCR
jgi:hypothetical protein